MAEGWRLFAGLNLTLWCRGTWQMLTAGHLPGVWEMIGLPIDALATLALFAYAYRTPIAWKGDFWGNFLKLFIFWSLLSTVVMIVGTRATLVGPMSYGVALAAALLI